MHTLVLSLFVSTFLVLNAQALTAPSANDNDVRWRQTTDQATPTPPSPKWTNETTFALLGVGATVFCFTIGLAWPRLRRCCTSRQKGLEPDPPILMYGVYGGHHGPPPVNPNVLYQQQGSPFQGHYNQTLIPGQYTHAHEQHGLAQSPYQQLPFYSQSPVHSQYGRIHGHNQNIGYQQQHPHFYHERLSPPYGHSPDYQVLQQNYGAPAPYGNFAPVPARWRRGRNMDDNRTMIGP